MLSHSIKNILDEATGLKASPVIGISEQLPMLSYRITDIDKNIINVSQLEVRVYSDNYDEIEEVNAKIDAVLASSLYDSWIDTKDYLIRGRAAGGGGILTTNELVIGFESTKYYEISWYKKS